MAKVNSGSPGCRAMVMAGKYLSNPANPASPALSRGSGQQRRMFRPQRRLVSSDAARAGGKAVALAQQELQGGVASAPDRHVLANRNLIYRDVKAFLNEMDGDPREARYWLTQFQRATSAQAPAFAVLEVGERNVLLRYCNDENWKCVRLFLQ